MRLAAAARRRCAVRVRRRRARRCAVRRGRGQSSARRAARGSRRHAVIRHGGCRHARCRPGPRPGPRAPPSTRSIPVPAELSVTSARWLLVRRSRRQRVGQRQRRRQRRQRPHVDRRRRSASGVVAERQHILDVQVADERTVGAARRGTGSTRSRASACSTAPTVGPVPSRAAGTARMSSQRHGTSATTRLRICSARVSRVCSSGSSSPSDSDSRDHLGQFDGRHRDVEFVLGLHPQRAQGHVGAPVVEGDQRPRRPHVQQVGRDQQHRRALRARRWRCSSAPSRPAARAASPRRSAPPRTTPCAAPRRGCRRGRTASPADARPRARRPGRAGSSRW